jgi:hypothetical protein
MARIWTTGFELGNPAHDLNTFTGSLLAGGVGGAYAIHLDGYGYNQVWAHTISPAIAEFYFACHFQTSGLSECGLVSWSKAGTILGFIRPTGTGYIQALVGSSTLVADSNPVVITTATWYRLDLYVKIANSGGRITVWIDDIQSLDYTGDTQPGADTTIDSLSGYGQWGGGQEGRHDYDNMALNDTTGVADTGRVGEGRIIALVPNSAGTNAAWVPLAGNNYAAVDDRPSDDDTTYVATATNAQKDTYNLAACGLAYVVIPRVWVELTALRGAGGGTNQIKPILISGATETIGTAISPGTAYDRHVSIDYTTDPNTGVNWTTAGLDAAEAGVQSVV